MKLLLQKFQEILTYLPAIILTFQILGSIKDFDLCTF